MVRDTDRWGPSRDEYTTGKAVFSAQYAMVRLRIAELKLQNADTYAGLRIEIIDVLEESTA